MRGMFIETPISFGNIAFITLLLRIGDIANKMSKMPLLFIIYINDMNKCSELNLVHYADDSIVYDVGTNLETLTS